ncbi:MAG: HAD-IIIA family hydrolase [bacterium]
MASQKIKNRKEIVRIVKNLKKQGKKIVTYNGSFDLLHSGHITSLEEAKSRGDILIVLLNSDQSVKSYKGPTRPIIPEGERARMLAALACVDYLVLFDEINPKKILSEIKSNVHCNGADWGRDCVEREAVEKNNGIIYILKWAPGFSTTRLIESVQKACASQEVKAVFFDRDGTINYNRPEYLHKIEDFRFVKGAIPALLKLSKTDYKIIIITNQSGIGRGYFKESDFQKLTKWLISYLKKRKIRIDRVYHCPHDPEAGCSCRKPAIGMLTKAVKELGVSLNHSWIIGDDERDVIMGREANVKTIKLGEKMKKSFRLQPNFYAKNLGEAVKIICAK